MFTSTTSHASALLAAVLVLTGGAIAGGGTAVADPSQDEQFGALLEIADIPSQANLPSLIATAHKVCGKLDGGMPVGALVDTMKNNAYELNPSLRMASARRLTSTMTRFITAAVEAYCPHNQGKITAGMASAAAHTHTAFGPMIMPAVRREPSDGTPRPDYGAHVTVLASLIGPVPSGEITPNPQIPPPPPPTAQIETPPRPIVVPQQPRHAPPPPKQPPPAPQQPPPPPKQPPPPAVAPHPGDAAGSGGGGGSGGTGGAGPGGPGGPGGPAGAGPAAPPAQPPMPPGVVRLAP